MAAWICLESLGTLPVLLGVADWVPWLGIPASTVLTWVISARVTTAVLVKQNEALQKQIEALLTKIDDLVKERARCELQCSRSYATRAELAHLLVQSAGDQRELFNRLDTLASSMRESVGKVHSRVDTIAERVTRTEERQAAAK